ncbi:HAMP domain-containing sensor histidine kinase, partial [Streptomyces populi]
MRGRATAAVTTIAALALAVCAVVLTAAVRSDLVGVARSAADDTLRGAEDQLSRGVRPEVVTAANPAITVVPPDEGTLSAEGSGTALTEAAGLPDRQTPLLEVTPDLSSARSATRTMTLWLLPSAVLLLLLVACLTWYAMGRALRPVEEIRAEFAEITATNLEHRVPVPPSGNEVSSLAGTMNTTLDQLHRAVTRLRTFTSDASHELRGPLTTLRTRLELALARPEESDWISTGQEALHDAARLQEIVQDLLFLARLDAGQPMASRPLAVADLVRQVVAEQYPESPVTVRSPAASATVTGSRSALSRLLTNLLDNALRHSPEAVAVDITLAPESVVVEVTDQGPGIPAADRERIFDRFTRLDDARTPAHGGSGLGLAIARDIAVAHQGLRSAEWPLRCEGRCSGRQ